MSTHKLDQARSHGFEIFEKTSFSVTSTENTEGWFIRVTEIGLRSPCRAFPSDPWGSTFWPTQDALRSTGPASPGASPAAQCWTLTSANRLLPPGVEGLGRARAKPFCWERFGMQYDAMPIQKNKCTEDMVGHTWVWHGMTMYDLASTSRSTHKLTTRTSTCSRSNVYNQMQNELVYAASSKICRVHMSLIRSNHLLVPVACSQVSSLPYQAWPV